MSFERPKVAVIPVAGRGTRWMPISRSVPKELLPVWRRTSASYAFEEALRAGCSEIIFVISPDKHEVLEHFMNFDASDLGPDYEGNTSSSLHNRIKIHACVQDSPKGLGHAILCAEKEVNHRPFVILLPDEVLMQNGITLLIDQAPSVLLMEVPFDQRSNYGIVKTKSDSDLTIVDLVEKPNPNLAPSSLAITGRYAFTPEIFDFLRVVQPGYGGEIQRTDAMRLYTKEYPMKGVIFTGTRHDVGQPMGLLTASLDFALRDKEFGPKIKPILQDLLKQSVSN